MPLSLLLAYAMCLEIVEMLSRIGTLTQTRSFRDNMGPKRGVWWRGGGFCLSRPTPEPRWKLACHVTVSKSSSSSDYIPPTPKKRPRHDGGDASTSSPMRRTGDSPKAAHALSLATEQETGMVVDLQAVNPRSAHSTASKLRLWKRVSSKAGFKSPPLTVKELKHVTGALIKAGYRTSMAYAGAAKAEHLEQGHPWTDSLQFAWRKALRASKKGIGPPSRATPFPILQLQDVTSEPEAFHEQGPTYPRRTVILCGWWMLRHIEAMHLRTTDVTLLDGSTTVHLRSSKGDLQHLGIARTLDCRCAQVGRLLCPNCLMTEHLQHFEGKDLPLFPDKSGEKHTLIGFIATLNALGLRLGIPETLGNGKPRWGGLSLRRGGVAMGAALGASATSLQHMARHAGLSIHRYMEGAPVIGLADALRIPSTPKHTPTTTTGEPLVTSSASASTTAMDVRERDAVPGLEPTSSSTEKATEVAQSEEGRWVKSIRGSRAHYVDPILEPRPRTAICGVAVSLRLATELTRKCPQCSRFIVPSHPIPSAGLCPSGSTGTSVAAGESG